MPDIREEFEAWIRTQVPEQFHPAALAYSAGNDLYLNPHIQGRYEGWKASRAALRVELPECFDKRDVQGLDYDETVAALQQAGIEVKQQ